jgi:AmmeMemoRadiSam system protein B
MSRLILPGSFDAPQPEPAAALRPRLRHIDIIETEHEGEPVFLLMDRERAGEAELDGGVGEGAVALSGAGWLIASRFTGRLTAAEIAADIRRRTGMPITVDNVAHLADRLDEAGLLDGERFRRRWREMPARPALRLLADDTGETNRELIAEMLGSAQGEPDAVLAGGRLAGLVAPHLDYPRGRPCYAEAFSLLARLRERSPEHAPRRFVILGTNHFGRSAGVCATDKDFATPLGIARNDRAFLDSVRGRLGGADLMEHDVDHLREHSIELHVRLLQHLYDGEDFSFAAFLCPDPTGPTGTKPFEGRGPDLDDFADALREAIAADPAATPTLVIASADFAHVGREFGDEELLNDEWLGRVRRQDRELLDTLEARDPAALTAHLRSDANRRRVCSAGCLYTLLRTVGPSARTAILGYHQAVDHETQTAVTCSAAAMVAG